MQIYVVKPSDTVDSIAASAGVPVDAVIRYNQIEYPYRLAVGQALLLPGGESSSAGAAAYGGTASPNGTASPSAPAPPQKQLIETNGYAYPFIDRNILEETLPFLTDLSVFSYGFTPEGDLVPPMADDSWMIQAARTFRTRPVLTLTPLGPDGHFNNNLVTALVEDAGVQQRLIWELGRTMQEKGYRGVDIDFEYVLAQDREEFARFVKKTAEVLHVFGYFVTVALAPKTSADQRGLLYEGIDYRLLGEAADRVMLMTYEWGYTFGPPMAVAPINMVRRVVDYAVTEIPREKILLGIPNYGYDWPLPYERGITRARTVGNIEAVNLAVGYGVEIRFDETAQSPYFHYWQYGVRHEVWFEDVRSMKAKFDLIAEYGLRGAGYWQIMRLFLANWLLLADTFSIEKVL